MAENPGMAKNPEMAENPKATEVDSRPTTPSAELPRNRSEARFHDIRSNTEWIERYRPGRFHPVHLGDVLHEGRYRVVRKLGYGSLSTVWLARDIREERYVALKILIATAPRLEITLLKELSRVEDSHPGKGHLVGLLDDFEIHGPNGQHHCLVMEPLGPSSNHMVEELPSNLPRRPGHTPRYPPRMAKEIIRQTLLALDFLHENGIVHADVQPGNLLFTIAGLDSVAEDAIGHETEDLRPVRRLDDKPDLWAPRYLVMDRALLDYAILTPKPVVKLADMNGAFRLSTPPSKPLTPLGLRTPESIFGNHVLAQGIDIWAVGCLTYEFLTGFQLFLIIAWNHDQDRINDQHLLQMNDILGALPAELFGRWSRQNRYFGPGGERLNSNSSTSWEAGGPDVVNICWDSLETSFQNRRPEEMDDKEVELAVSFMRDAMRYNPLERPSARDLLAHAWLATEDGSESA